jgi:hypothetical protein
LIPVTNLHWAILDKIVFKGHLHWVILDKIVFKGHLHWACLTGLRLLWKLKMALALTFFIGAVPPLEPPFFLQIIWNSSPQSRRWPDRKPTAADCCLLVSASCHSPLETSRMVLETRRMVARAHMELLGATAPKIAPARSQSCPGSTKSVSLG